MERLQQEGTLINSVTPKDREARLKRQSSFRSNYNIHLPKNRRKERLLSTVIKKVALWRELHAGILVKNSDGTVSKHEYTLDEAAYKTGVSKKSLDDYML